MFINRWLSEGSTLLRVGIRLCEGTSLLRVGIQLMDGLTLLRVGIRLGKGTSMLRLRLEILGRSEGPSLLRILEGGGRRCTHDPLPALAIWSRAARTAGRAAVRAAVRAYRPRGELLRLRVKRPALWKTCLVPRNRLLPMEVRRGGLPLQLRRDGA